MRIFSLNTLQCSTRHKTDLGKQLFIKEPQFYKQAHLKWGQVESKFLDTGLGKKEGDLWGVHLGLWEEQACAGVERRVPGSGALTLQMGKKVTGTNLPFFQCLLKAGPNRVIGCGNRKLTDDGVQPESIFLDSCTSAPSPIFCCTAQARKHLFPPLDFLLGPRTPVSAQVPLRRSSVGHWSPQGTSPLLTTSCFHRRMN